MIRILYYTAGQVHTDLTPTDLVALLPTLETGVLWVDVVEEPTESAERLLLHTFGFHPLAVDDALQEIHVPKVDDWSEYLYLVLHSITVANAALHTQELDCFLGPHYLVTYQCQAMRPVARVWDALLHDQRVLRRGAVALLYTLLDTLVDEHLHVIETLDDEIDQVEDAIFGEMPANLLERIFDLKRTLLQLRRILGPQRETVNKLTRSDYALIAAEDRMYFRDVYDHLVRMYDLCENMRDLVSGALDLYLSVVNNRMNEVMKILTVITTLFMPLSFVVGFFGMNFFQPAFPLPAWTGPAAFYWMLIGMLAAPLMMYLWMRRRSWM